MDAPNVTVKEPPGKPDAGTVSVDAGQRIVLEVADSEKGGSWLQDGAAPAQPARIDEKSITLIMDRAGTVAGRYQYKLNDVLSAGTKVQLAVKHRLISRLVKRGLPAIAATVAYGLMTYFDLKGSASGKALTTRAYLFAVLTLLYVLLILWMAGRSATTSGGLAYLVQGADRRASTSKFQYLLWTFGVAFALAYISARAGLSAADNFNCTGTAHANCVPPDNWDAYLILLGVPAATAVIAKGVTAYKVENGVVQKTSAESAKVADIATNDNGQADLADVQYLIFNVIAFGYVAVGFAHRGVLVEVPSILLGLTSAAAATYVLNKSLQTDKPSISSVSPSVVAVGTPITIYGRNLFPPGTSNAVRVTIGGVGTEGSRASTDSDNVRLIGPAGMTNADPSVVVTTGANVTTDKYSITVAGLALIGVVGRAPARRQEVALRVDGLAKKEGDEVSVTFGSFSATGRVGSDGVVAVTIPEDVPTGRVDTKVGVDGRWSEPMALTIA